MASEPKSQGSFLTSIRNVIDPPVDPHLVDNTPKLLDLLNKSERVHKLLNRRDDRGYTLIHLAAERNQPESLKCLLIKSGNPNVRSGTSSAEVTPLHVSASAGHLACLQLLVQLGGDVLARDIKQLTPIDYANINGQELCLNYLHEVISNRQMEERRELEDVLVEVERNLAANNVTTLTPWRMFNDFFPLVVTTDVNTQLSQTESLMYRQCLLINNHNLVRVLSRIAKDVPLTHSHCSLLHAAARYGRLELARLLLEKVPQIALSVTAEGYNALHVAVAHKQMAVVKLLTQRQVQWTRQKPHSPTDESTLEGSMSLGVAKFGSTTMSGHTVLHFAVAMGNQEALHYMLKYHRELQLGVNANECGYTPLHLAVFLNNLEAAQLILRKGGNPNMRIDSALLDKVHISRTPLTEAAINKNLPIVNLLLEYGADDRHHDALKVCVPSHNSNELLPPLLGTLVRQDDAHKPPKSSHKDRQIKMAAVEWSNLHLTELPSSWFTDSVRKSLFLRSQGIDRSKVMDYVTSINLSNNSLSVLPVEIFHLPRLTTLNASNNNLVSIPEIYKQNIGQEHDPYQWPCAALTKLNVSKNSLADLPEFLFFLPKLTHLDISHNNLRRVTFAVWSSPKLHTLNISHNSIEQLPTNWPQVLSDCTVINASPPVDSSAQATSPTSFKQSPSIKTPKEDQLPRSLPHSVESPVSTEEDGSEREVTPISKLQDRLNIANAHLPIEWTSLLAGEEDYEGLAILNLSHNNIELVPDNFPCLAPKLKRLDLSFNQLESLCIPRSFPSTLTNLYLSNNPLMEINCQTTLAKPLPCTNPQVLIDNNNTIHVDNLSFCPHRSHNQLLSLGVLEANNCQLEVVNFYSPQVAVATTGGGGANNATTDPLVIATEDRGVGKKPSNIQSLRRLVTPLLTRLTLNHNNLTDVPESVCEITSLTSLDLSHNGIIQLPANLGNLGNLWEFPLAGLKLISPPHNIIERGKTKDIIGFLWSLLQKARPYHRMKLMLVGLAARGKTTLLSRISERGQRGIQENWGTKRMNDVSTNLSTVGIVVSDWTYYRRVRVTQTSLKSITFMTWDFGGQEEYYATHQCFLSRRSLYLVVWNVTHGMKGVEELKPWLLNIQARAPHSPVLIVGTHTDRVSSRSQRHEVNQCLDFINNRYGTAEIRKEGFPQVMGNFQVSCKSGRGIGDLRDTIFDVASQVKENTVAGRGIGCGRIPEYRLLMDQLVPASYLQLEDTVRKIAYNMRLAGKPPVLTYKELREHVFTDPNTLFSKSSVDRELEQAVRFLHDNGTMLHYDDPLLCDLYFVDPQWLCDMLAHIITVRQINPMIRDGVMKIRDFKHIFNDIEFPIRWQREYIRLLTMFEVVVELGGGELLIPSTLPPDKPNLPRSMFPEELKLLPALRHVYLVPFIPSGFWPRLISRLLTDVSLLQLAKNGCGLADDEMDQLSWVKWRTGMILQYGNLKLLYIGELDEGLFPGASNLQGIKVFSDDKWRLHRPDVDIFGINIQVPDVYPILKYPEAKSRSKYVRVRPWTRQPARAVVKEPSDGSHDVDGELHSDTENESGDLVASERVQRVIRMEQVDDEFERLCKQRSRLHTSGAALGLERVRPQEEIRKSKSVENLVDATASTTTLPQRPRISEDAHDIMRVGLLSKVVEHISLLVEDWFVGVRPRTLVVPCPHCSADLPHLPVTLRRSFSEVKELLPQEGLREREEQQPGNTPLQPTSGHPRTSKPATHDDIRRHDSLCDQGQSSTTAARPAAHTEARSSMSPRHAARQRSLSPEPYYYAFRYNDCVVTARNLDTMFCPAHGDVQLQYMAPDTLFLMQGKDVIISDVSDLEKIGQGAFATVFKATYRKTGPEGEQETLVALKALTKECRVHESSHGNLDPNVRTPRPPSRHSIVEGFTNLKKELSILSPLEHDHVIRLFGIMLRPLGLVLELAPQGSMKDALKAYNEAEVHISVTVLQPLIAQIASAIQYLHASNIIYRDLKSDNILVWKFPDPLDPVPKPDPGQQLGLDTVYVKLSDYGISQFAATQGARGLVGTPGFIAPEILKYHGREVYTRKVDIFSFGMLIYELITLRIPYENLNAQQANQANERGSRPSLTRKDFPCPVLVRELMVWCWQQDPELRPNGYEIIEATKLEQFPRLLDGIRACNSGQITSTCVRAITPTAFMRGGSRRRHSPSNFSFASRSPLASLTPSTSAPLASLTTSTVALESVNEESGVGDPSNQHVSVEWRVGDPGNQRASIEKRGDDPGNQRASIEKRGDDPGNQRASIEKRGDDPGNDDSVFSTDGQLVNRSSQTRQSDGAGKVTPNSLGSSNSLDTTFSPQRRFSLDEPRSKYIWSPRTSDQLTSPFSDEDQLSYELWVSSNDARHSTATVIEYSGRFIGIEDLELGDSPVLCMCAARDKVWLGFEIGYLMVFDSHSRKPCIQSWIKQHMPILSLAYIPALKKVYVGLADGSILAYSDDIASGSNQSLTSGPARVKLIPIAEYSDPSQTSSCLLAIPKIAPSGEQTCRKNSSDPSNTFELWVGQKRGVITILDAETLTVVKFIRNTLDLSKIPSYVAYLSYAHLVCGLNPDYTGSGSREECVSVYGALYHGQFVTRWDAGSKKELDSHSCHPFMENESEDCCISAMLYSHNQLYVGLTSGIILIFDPYVLMCLGRLTNHRGAVASLLTLNLSLLQPQTDDVTMMSSMRSRQTDDVTVMSSMRSRRGSDSSMYQSSDGQSLTQRSPSLTSLQSGVAPISNQLLSFGAGFKSYIEDPQSTQNTEAGFLLVWDSEHWNETKLSEQPQH